MDEARPEFCAGNDGSEVTHHLAAVTDAEGECVGAREEGFEFLSSLGVEEDAFGPAFPGTEDIAVAETAAGCEAAKILEGDPTFEDVGHVHIDRFESCFGEGGGHFHFAVHALFAKDGDGWV